MRRRWSPSLGCLETFLQVASHRSWTKAGAALGLHGSNVTKRVEHLQGWFGKRLMLSGHQPEVCDPDGKLFAEIAAEVIEKFRRNCAEMPEITKKSHLTRPVKWQCVEIFDLECFLELEKCKNYKLATKTFDSNVDVVRKRVIFIENVIGRNLFLDNSKFDLTSGGEKFARDARWIVGKIMSFREESSEDNHGTADYVRKLLENYKNLDEIGREDLSRLRVIVKDKSIKKDVREIIEKKYSLNEIKKYSDDYFVKAMRESARAIDMGDVNSDRDKCD